MKRRVIYCLPERDYSYIRQVSESKGISMSEVIRRAIELLRAEMGVVKPKVKKGV